MSDDEERDRRGRFERTRSPQQRRRSRSPAPAARSRSPGVERRSDDPGRAERPGPDDPPATLFVAELPPNLQVGALETLCVEMPVRNAFVLLTSSQAFVSVPDCVVFWHLLALGTGVHEQPPPNRSWRAVRCLY